LGAALLGGLATGFIPNPLAPTQPNTASPAATESNASSILPSATLNEVTETSLPPEASATALLSASATFTLTSTPAATATPEPLLPYFTANENMLCRGGPGTEYVDHWQLIAGEVVQVLAQWGANSDWLLVDINVPAEQTRTDCCWVAGNGTLNVSRAQIKSINFVPDRLDCSTVR